MTETFSPHVKIRTLSTCWAVAVGLNINKNARMPQTCTGCKSHLAVWCRCYSAKTIALGLCVTCLRSRVVVNVLRSIWDSTWYLEPTLIEWLNVGGVLRLLHAQIASGRTKGTVYVDHVLVILVASVAMLVFKGVLRSWSILYIPGLWETYI